jgi:hypothetical protein
VWLIGKVESAAFVPASPDAFEERVAHLFLNAVGLTFVLCALIYLLKF